MTENPQEVRRTRGRAGRALSTLAILSLSTVCVVTIGANALFTSTKATDDGGAAGGTDVSTGTVVLTLGANGATTNSISIDASTWSRATPSSV